MGLSHGWSATTLTRCCIFAAVLSCEERRLTCAKRSDQTWWPIADAHRSVMSVSDYILIDPPYSKARAISTTPARYPAPGVILRETARLLRPGGKVGLLHFKFRHSSPAQDVGCVRSDDGSGCDSRVTLLHKQPTPNERRGTMTDHDPWAGTSGLRDDFDGTITSFKFVYDSEYNNGQTLIARRDRLVRTAASPRCSSSTGSGWEDDDKGTKAKRRDGRNPKGFSKSQRAAVLRRRWRPDFLDTMKKSVPWDGTIWAGNKFHFVRRGSRP